MNTSVAYVGVALPTNGTTVILFSTVLSFQMANALQMNGIHRVTIDLKTDQNGTAKMYKSHDRGANWTQVDSQAITGASTSSSVIDCLIQEYPDYKVEYTPGADTTVFDPSISLTSQRSLGK